MTEPHAADPLELAGRLLLERYRIGERLANGGMSVVYRAMDERLQRPVCVKVFHGLSPTQSVYQTSYEHFVQEAFALSQLQHPNTIRIYDFGYLVEEPKSPFHVSELLDGGTLLTVVRKQGKLETNDALDILDPIAQALGEAHARNIIHRDIKPTNILFGMAGKTRIVKLCDFGIAKAYMEADKVEAERIPNRAQDTVAASGRRISLYSPGWAAPEQLRARPCGPPADVYALGLLAAFILTGKKVYNDRDPLETLQKRMEGDEYVADTLLTFDLPQAVRDVLVRACRAKPDDRFQTASDFVTALRIALTKPRLGAQDDDDDTSRIAARDLLRTQGETVGGVPVATPSPPPVRPSDVPTMIPAPSPLGYPSAVPVPAPQPSNIPTGADVPLPGPILPLAQLEDTNLVAAGRRVRVLPIADQLDLGGEGDVRSPARVRVTFTPSPTDARVHMRGLNCFLQRAGARLASAVDVNGDTDIALLTAAREPLDTIRCTFGFAEGAVRLFPMPNATLAVPLRLAQHLVLFDFGPGRDLVLVHHAQRSR